MAKKCIIIVGMHRSGTSALAGLMHKNGVFMGEDANFYPGPARENPLGFFENFRFRSVNDMILAHNDYYVKFFSPYIPDNIVAGKKAIDIMRQLIHEYTQEHSVWGFKDPRVCLTLGIWKQVFSDYKQYDIDLRTVMITRPVEAIAASMKRRGNQGTIQQFKDMAKFHYKNAMSFGPYSIVISFKDLISDTKKTADRLSDALDISITNLSHIDPSLSHH